MRKIIHQRFTSRVGFCHPKYFLRVKSRRGPVHHWPHNLRRFCNANGCLLQRRIPAHRLFPVLQERGAARIELIPELISRSDSRKLSCPVGCSHITYLDWHAATRLAARGSDLATLLGQIKTGGDIHGVQDPIFKPSEAVAGDTPASKAREMSSALPAFETSDVVPLALLAALNWRSGRACPASRKALDRAPFVAAAVTQSTTPSGSFRSSLLMYPLA